MVPHVPNTLWSLKQPSYLLQVLLELLLPPETPSSSPCSFDQLHSYPKTQLRFSLFFSSPQPSRDVLETRAPSPPLHCPHAQARSIVSAAINASLWLVFWAWPFPYSPENRQSTCSRPGSVLSMGNVVANERAIVLGLMELTIEGH